MKIAVCVACGDNSNEYNGLRLLWGRNWESGKLIKFLLDNPYYIYSEFPSGTPPWGWGVVLRWCSVTVSPTKSMA